MSEMSRDPLADKHSPFNQPAFPRIERQGDTPEFVYYGMSLRDYYRAHAPFTLADAAAVGGWTSDSPPPVSEDLTRAILMEMLVLLRDEYADAMLRVRRQRQERFL